MRALVNGGTSRFVETQQQVAERFHRGEISQEQAQLEIELFWAGALKRAVIDGDVENGSLMAGQSVGMVRREQPIAEIIAELVAADDRGAGGPGPEGSGLTDAIR